MLKLLGVIGGWQGYAAAAGLAALLSIAATWYLVSLPYKLTIANMQTAEQHKLAVDTGASLDQLKTFISTMSAAGAAHQEDIKNLQDQLATIDRKFRDAIKAKPLPLDCKPDTDRVRAFDSAIAAANSAASGSGPGPAMSATH